MFIQCVGSAAINSKTLGSAGGNSPGLRVCGLGLPEFGGKVNLLNLKNSKQFVIKYYIGTQNCLNYILLNFRHQIKY